MWEGGELEGRSTCLHPAHSPGIIHADAISADIVGAMRAAGRMTERKSRGGVVGGGLKLAERRWKLLPSEVSPQRLLLLQRGPVLSVFLMIRARQRWADACTQRKRGGLLASGCNAGTHSQLDTKQQKSCNYLRGFLK